MKGEEKMRRLTVTLLLVPLFGGRSRRNLQYMRTRTIGLAGQFYR